jgi:hypothetical protein
VKRLHSRSLSKGSGINYGGTPKIGAYEYLSKSSETGPFRGSLPVLKILLTRSCKSLLPQKPSKNQVFSGLFQTFTTITKVRNKTGVLAAGIAYDLYNPAAAVQRYRP